MYFSLCLNTQIYFPAQFPLLELDSRLCDRWKYTVAVHACYLPFLLTSWGPWDRRTKCSHTGSGYNRILSHLAQAKRQPTLQTHQVRISIGVQKLSLVPSMARNSANGLHRTGIKACAQNINIRNCHVMSDNPLIAVGWSIRSTPSWRTLFKLASKNLQPVEGIRTVACHCCRKQNGNLNDHRRVFLRLR